ncbi:MAG: hypothetical protein IKN96_03810 [Oscillibacter sp.]|nr:hypothetical protein [Oscillibacter sp.]
MSRKRRIAALLCACFLLPLACYAATSRDGLYFVAVENVVAPLTEDTMPFWHDGYLYVSADIFTGNVRDAIGISRAKIGDGVLLYRGEQSLLFRNGYPYAQDSQEETYAPGMVLRDGNAYVPASVAARYFNLTYSTVEVERGKLVWLRSASFKMSDAAFAKAAAFQLNAVYQEYLKSTEPEPEPPRRSEPDPGETTPPKIEPETPEPPDEPPVREELAEPAETEVPEPEPETEAPPVSDDEPTTPAPVAPSVKPAPPSVPVTTPKPSAPSATKPAPVAPSETPVAPPSAPAPTEPAAPPGPQTEAPTVAAAETPTETAPEIRGGQRIYLCLRGDGSASELLDVLDRRDIRAAVFCDEAFLSEQGDLLRRMAATGHRVGLYVGAGDAASVLERLEACNAQLRRTTMEKTRLAFIDGAGEELLRAARNAGFLCIRPALDADSLRTSRQAADLLRAVSQQSDGVTVWLGGTVSRSGLNSFLSDALEAGDAFPPPNETSLP